LLFVLLSHPCPFFSVRFAVFLFFLLVEWATAAVRVGSAVVSSHRAAHHKQHATPVLHY
jgi:hypothetical protein